MSRKVTSSVFNVYNLLECYGFSSHIIDTMGSRSRPWYRIRWFADEDTAEERRLILKLDLLIVPYAFLAYWVKYIDQANISACSPLLASCLID